jgi:arylformamidase
MNAPVSPAEGTLGPYRMVRLSRVLDPATEKRRCAVRRYEAHVLGVSDYHSEIDIMSHLGTHVEAPYHQADDWPDTAALPLETYAARGVLLRLDTCAPKALIPRAALDVADAGTVRAGDVVLLDSPYQHEPFQPSPDDDRPQLSEESARWFVEKGVKAVGFGTGIAIENNPEHCVACHQVLMPEGITFIEVMDNLDLIRHKVFLYVGLPLPIRGLDSSPVHALAIEGVPGFDQ